MEKYVVVFFSLLKLGLCMVGVHVIEISFCCLFLYGNALNVVMLVYFNTCIQIHRFKSLLLYTPVFQDHHSQFCGHAIWFQHRCVHIRPKTLWTTPEFHRCVYHVFVCFPHVFAHSFDCFVQQNMMWVSLQLMQEHRSTLQHVELSHFRWAIHNLGVWLKLDSINWDRKFASNDWNGHFS